MAQRTQTRSALIDYRAESMTPDQAERAFGAFIARRGAHLERLSVEQVVDYATDFYANHRVSGANLADDEDMLLFEWGMSTVEGRERFEFDLTRQFIWAPWLTRFLRVHVLRWEPADATVMSQLNLKMVLEPSDALSELGKGSQWCRSPAEVARFREMIIASPPYKMLTSLDATPMIELRFGLV
jgi:hypothetical protein